MEKESNGIFSSKRNLYTIAGIVFLLIVVLVSILLLMYFNTPEKKLRLGAQIDAAVLDEQKSSAYIRLKAGSNEAEITGVKFTFRSFEEQDYSYETNKGIEEISVPFERTFWDWLFSIEPRFEGVYEYKVIATDLNLPDFQGMEFVDVIFRYEVENNSFNSSVLDTSELDIENKSGWLLEYEQRTTGGGSPGCRPSKTCADYPGQCSSALSNGCSNVLDCSGNCNALVGEVCEAGICVAYECNDSDYGRNYTEKGITKRYFVFNFSIVEEQNDTCIIGTNNLTEYYCIGAGIVSEIYECSSQCLNGACSELSPCGNNLIDFGEECDGTDLSGQTCIGLGYDAGDLSCFLDCTYNISACSYFNCDDGVRQGNEECDTLDLGGQTCIGLGYDVGDLSCCSGSCNYNESACFNETKTCIDNDAGPNNYSIGSKVDYGDITDYGPGCLVPAGSIGGFGESFDSCSGNILNEAFCDDNESAYDLHDCALDGKICDPDLNACVIDSTCDDNLDCGPETYIGKACNTISTSCDNVTFPTCRNPGILTAYCENVSILQNCVNCPSGCDPVTGECIIVISCQDSDLDVAHPTGYDIYERGTCPGADGGTDYCIDSNTLREYYCGGLTKECTYLDVYCSGGCSLGNGVCKTAPFCIDSDVNRVYYPSGRNPFVVGTCTDLDSQDTDYCVTSKRLREYFCSGTTCVYTHINCDDYDTTEPIDGSSSGGYITVDYECVANRCQGTTSVSTLSFWKRIIDWFKNLF